MKRLIGTTLLFLFLTGCQGISQHIVHGEGGVSYKMEEVYSVGLFTPTWQYKRASECETVPAGIEESKWALEENYDLASVKNCKVIGAKGDGFTADTTGPVGPALISGVSSIATGAIIADGIRDSSDSVNSNNVQSQAQGQIQGQKQSAGRGWTPPGQAKKGVTPRIEKRYNLPRNQGPQ